jgi:hypothetical protein
MALHILTQSFTSFFNIKQVEEEGLPPELFLAMPLLPPPPPLMGRHFETCEA